MSKQDCPQPAALQGLMAGKLPMDQVENLAQHLEQCRPCTETVAMMKNRDTLIELMNGIAPMEIPKEDARWMERLFETACALPAETSKTVECDDAQELFDPAQNGDEIGRLGSYPVFEKLGFGGMGEVWLAEDPKLGRKVAIKVMRPALAANPDHRERFLREAKAMGRINHDNVATIFHVGETKGVPFLVMELLEGETLDKRMASGEKMPVEEMVRIVREAAKGLATAHSRGLVHRDIKPGNIWLGGGNRGSSQRVKILDFGLARTASDDGRLTHSGLILGTPAYMAPEQANGEAVDGRSDLFGLGCILYQMCTGRIPFQGKTSLAILAALTNDTPVPVRSLNPSIPQSLEKLIMQLLAKDSAQRPNSAEEVVNRLNAILDELNRTEIESKPAPRQHQKQSQKQTTMPAPQTAVASRTKRWSLIAATAAVALTLLGGGIALLQLLDFGGGPANLAAKNKLDAVVAALKNRNPEFDGKVKHKIENGAVVELQVQTDNIADISPIRKLKKLQTLYLRGSANGKGKLKDLSPLKGMGLKALYCKNNQKISTLNPLQSMRLRKLEIGSTRVSDLTPLKNMALDYLDIHGCSGVKSLAALQGLPLQWLNCHGTQVSDLTPLKGMPLTCLHCGLTQVTSLKPLAGLPLQFLHCQRTEISDLTPLTGMKLSLLTIIETRVKDLSPLKGMPLAGVSADKTQVSDLSPLEGMPLTGLGIGRTPVRDLTPLKEMKSLKNLHCGETKISDLRPIQDLKLTWFDCSNTRVSSLSPLQDMPLTVLDCQNTEVTDLTPIRNMPLVTLSCPLESKEQWSVIRSIATLRQVNGTPIELFDIAKKN